MPLRMPSWLRFLLRRRSVPPSHETRLSKPSNEPRLSESAESAPSQPSAAAYLDQQESRDSPILPRMRETQADYSTDLVASPTIRMLCLANLIKLEGRCIAGIDVAKRRWLRPVSSLVDGVLLPPALLDVLEISFRRAAPKPFQPENWITNGQTWRKVGELDAPAAQDFLQTFIEPGPLLLGSQGDRVDASLMSLHPLQASLALIEPEVVQRAVLNARGKRKQVRVRFRLVDSDYDLSITDPLWRERFAQLPVGYYPYLQARIPEKHKLLFTVSLGEPFNGSCFELVAGVLTLPPSSRG